MGETFSKRQGLGGAARPAIFDDAPQKLRIGIWNLIEDYIDHKCLPTILPYYETLYTRITTHFRLERTPGANPQPKIQYMVLTSLRWNEIYDLVEFLFTQVSFCELDEYGMEWITFPEKTGSARYQYTKDINHILSSEYIGWKLKKGQLERIGSEVLDREKSKKPESYSSRFCWSE